MATWRDVRRIALALPETSEGVSFGKASWSVKGKLFAWERPLRRSDLAALGDAAPKGAILGVRTPDLEMKEVLLARNPGVYFTTPHFDGYPAVLIRLAKIRSAELKSIVLEAWLARAPQRGAGSFLQERGRPVRSKRTPRR